jgi:hypothetical protein
MTIALILFALTYVGLLTFQDKRHWVALASAALFVILGILPVGNVFGTIDFNVLMMIAGTMGIVSLFIDSQMPMLLADLILAKTPNVKWAVVFLSLFAGVVSGLEDTGESVSDSRIMRIEVTADAGLNVRSGPDVSNEKYYTAAKGTQFYAYETRENGGYTWYRIGNDQWIADQDNEWIKVLK